MVTGSYKQIKVWDIQLGKCVNTLIYYIDGWVKCLYPLSDDIIVHCSKSNIIFTSKLTLESDNCESDNCESDNCESDDYESDNVNIDKTWFIDHTSPVNCLLLLRDGRLASGSDDKSIKIWIVAKRICILTLLGHTDSVLSFAATEKCELISSSRDNTIKMWNLTSGQCLKTLCEDATWIDTFLNEFLVSASMDNTIKVWNLDSGTCVHTFLTQQSGVNSMVLMQ